MTTISISKEKFIHSKDSTIPMSPDSYASSFNVSCAVLILMYEIVRQRDTKI